MSSCCCGNEPTECCHCPPGRQQKTSLIRKIVGPYPDEVIMSALDSLLYWWGAKNIKHMMNMQALEAVSDKSCPPLPSCSSAGSDVCSYDSSTCRSSNASPSRGKAIDWRKASSGTSSPKPPCIKTSSSRLSAAASCPQRRYPRVDFAHPAVDIQKRQHAGNCDIKERLEDACLRLKTYLSSKDSQRSECNTQKWLWTRLVCTKNGSQVYEVYKNSNANCSPCKIGSEAPSIVFVIMRNGTIMPFESIKV